MWGREDTVYGKAPPGLVPIHNTTWYIPFFDSYYDFHWDRIKFDDVNIDGRTNLFCNNTTSEKFFPIAYGLQNTETLTKIRYHLVWLNTCGTCKNCSFFFCKVVYLACWPLRRSMAECHEFGCSVIIMCFQSWLWDIWFTAFIIKCQREGGRGYPRYPRLVVLPFYLRTDVLL